MAGLSFSIDAGLALKRIGSTEEKSRRAIARALNLAAIAGRAEAARGIQQEGFRFKIGTIKKALKIGNAVATDPRPKVSIGAKGSPIPLIKFEVYPKPVSHGAAFNRPAVGIYANALGKSFGDQHFFFARVGSGGKSHVGVFVREGSTRLPIKQQYGPPLPDGLAAAAVVAATGRAFYDRFAVAYDQQLSFELSR